MPRHPSHDIFAELGTLSDSVEQGPMGLDGAERFRLASTSTTLSARSGNRRSERLLEPNRSTPRDKVGTSLAQKTGVDYTSSVENESPPSLLLLVHCPHCALAMNFLRRLDDRIRLRPAKGSLSNNSRLSNHGAWNYSMLEPLQLYDDVNDHRAL